MFIIKLLLISLTVFFCNGDAGMNNFRLDSKSIDYSDALPLTILLHFTYHLDVSTESPNLASLPSNLTSRQDFTVKTLLGNSLGPWMCTGKADQILTTISDKTTTDRILANIGAMNDPDFYTASNLETAFKNIIETKIKPVIDINDPDYNCVSIKNKLEDFGKGGSYKFEIQYTYTVFKSIFFVDYFGVGSHTLKQKVVNAGPQKKSGCALRFCNNHDYNYEIYTMEPRPICPDTVPEILQNATYGYITVYKPNIVTVRRKAIACEMWRSFYSAYAPMFTIYYYDIGIFETDEYDMHSTTDPQVSNIISKNMPVTVEECYDWYKTKKCGFDKMAKRDNDIMWASGCGKKVARKRVIGAKPGSDIDFSAEAFFSGKEQKERVLTDNDVRGYNPGAYLFDGKDCNYYANHPNEDTLMEFGKAFGTSINVGTVNGTYNMFATQPLYDHNATAYPGIHLEYHKRRGEMTVGFLDIMMPSLQLVTPWGIIPTDQLQNNGYVINGKTIIYDPIDITDICLYVPRYSGYVDVLTYKTGDSQLESDPNIKAKELKYLIASSSKSMFVVDDTMRMNDTNPLYCIASGPKDELYLTPNDEIIRFTPTANKLDPVFGTGDRYYAHNAFDKIYINPDKEIIGVKSYAATLNDVKAGNSSVVLVARKTPVNRLVPAPAQDNGNLNDATNKAQDSQEIDMSKIKPMKELTTIDDVKNYITWMNVLQENRNLHIRAVQNCLQSQLDWDIFQILLPIDPTMALSARTGRAIEARFAGNGFYNTRDCDLIFNYNIVPYLFTNVTAVNITLNKMEYTFSYVMASMQIKSDYKKCLSMPLIKFRLGDSANELIGQLQPNGVINTYKITYMEECIYNVRHIFAINDEIILFQNYEFLKRLPAAIVLDKVEIAKGIDDLIVNGEIVTKDVRTFIQSIRFINLAIKIVEETIKDFSGATTVPTNLYSRSESMSQINSLLDLIQHTVSQNMANRITSKKLEVTDNSIYEICKDAANIKECVIGGSNRVPGGPSSKGGRQNGAYNNNFDYTDPNSRPDANRLLTDFLSIFQSTGSKLSGTTIAAIVVPIVVVAVIGIGGFALYMLVFRKKKKDIVKSDPSIYPPPDSDYDEDQEDQEQYDDDDENNDDDNNDDNDGDDDDEEEIYNRSEKKPLIDDSKLYNRKKRINYK